LKRPFKVLVFYFDGFPVRVPGIHFLTQSFCKGRKTFLLRGLLGGGMVK